MSNIASSPEETTSSGVGGGGPPIGSSGSTSARHRSVPGSASSLGLATTTLNSSSSLSAAAATASTISPSSAQSPPRRSSQNLFYRFFGSGSKDKHSERALISNEGSISDHAWKGMNAATPKKTRLDMLRDLHESPVYRTFHGSTARLRANSSLFNLFKNGGKREEISDTERLRAVMHNRTLQVSTLEGIWHEIKDALEIADMREPALRLLIDLTEQQYKQLGLALRHTFFEAIRQLGCGEHTLRWLTALSENGKNPNGFEREMDILLANWVVSVLNDEAEHPQALHVLHLVQNYIKSNAAFISEENTVKILAQVTHRGSQGMSEPMTKECLNIVDSVLKFSDLPRTSLFKVVCMVAVLVCEIAYRDQTWKLAKALLTSQLGHRTFNVMLRILEIDSSIEGGVNEVVFERMLRGCVFCLANANWGTSQIDTVRVITPALIIPSMQKAVAVSESVCRDVLFAIRRLILKHGKDLQPVTWLAIINLFERIFALVDQKLKHHQDCEPELHELLRLVEQLYKDNQFSANPDYLFDLIEKCSLHMQDSSVLKLIEYRTSNINPQVVDWIAKMQELISKYSKAHSSARRSKAIDELHTFYNRYRMCYESELVYQLMLPCLADTHLEENNQNQYKRINVLLDVLKSVSMKGDLFKDVVNVYGDLFTEKMVPPSLTGELTMFDETDSVITNGGGKDESIENLEIMAKGLGDVLAERWTTFDEDSLNIVLEILIRFLRRQYVEQCEHGADVRIAAFAPLLVIQCCPITGFLQYYVARDESTQQTLYVKRCEARTQENGFTWQPICQLVITCLRDETLWSVVSCVLRDLARIIENAPLITTLHQEQLEEFTTSLIALFDRSQTGAFKEFSEVEMNKYLPPLLSALLNYTSNSQSKRDICKVLVACVSDNNKTHESVVACCTAAHIVPSLMASFAHRLMDALASLTPSSASAIPVLELLSDTADIEEFHKFFDEKQFSRVMSVIGNYGNVNKFSPFVISSMHRTAMRWFIRVPEAKRAVIKDALNRKLDAVLSQPYILASGDELLNTQHVSRQPSGDGRQISGALFTLGAQQPPETPPISGSATSAAPSKPEKILAEVRHVLEAFFKSPLIVEVQGDADVPPNLKEASSEHYFLNDTLVSVRTLVDAKLLEREEANENVFSESVGKTEGTNGQSSQMHSNFLEERRRNASAVQGGSRRRVDPLDGESRRALDDCLAITQSGGNEFGRSRIQSLSRTPAITFTQMIVRHAHGKSCWTMRSLDEWPEDFEKTVSLPLAASSLLHHISTLNGAVKLGQRGKDEDLMRGLRLLDRMPAMDLHQIGVLYMALYQTQKQDVLSNLYGSDAYNDFVKSLGDPFPLDSEMRNTALIYGKHGAYSYYYMDELCHIIYAVGTIMPNLEEDPKRNQKTKIIGNNEVCVVWNESGTPFKYGMLFGSFQQSALEIVPHGPAHVLVQIHAKKEVQEWMTMKRVLLPRSRAPSVVRKLTQRLSIASIMHNHEKAQGDSTPSSNSHQMSGAVDDLPFISHAIERIRKIRDIRDRNAT